MADTITEYSFQYLTHEVCLINEPVASMTRRGGGSDTIVFEEGLHLEVRIESSKDKLDEAYLRQVAVQFHIIPVTRDTEPTSLVLVTPLLPIAFARVDKVCFAKVNVPGFVGDILAGPYVLAAHVMDQGLVEAHENLSGSVAFTTSEIFEIA